MPYIYSADIYCDDCGEAIRDNIPNSGEFDDDTLYDSDEYPKYCCGDSSADSPQHCGDCGEFLENDLTEHGAQYVFDAIKRDIESGALDSVAVTVWLPYYAPRSIDNCYHCGKLAIVNNDDLCRVCSDLE